MFALVKFEDGVKKIVPTKHIKHFDDQAYSHNKKYNILWNDEEYYEGVILIVGSM